MCPYHEWFEDSTFVILTKPIPIHPGDDTVIEASGRGIFLYSLQVAGETISGSIPDVLYVPDLAAIWRIYCKSIIHYKFRKYTPFSLQLSHFFIAYMFPNFYTTLSHLHTAFLTAYNMFPNSCNLPFCQVHLGALVVHILTLPVQVHTSKSMCDCTAGHHGVTPSWSPHTGSSPRRAGWYPFHSLTIPLLQLEVPLIQLGIPVGQVHAALMHIGTPCTTG